MNVKKAAVGKHPTEHGILPTTHINFGMAVWTESSQINDKRAEMKISHAVVGCYCSRSMLRRSPLLIERAYRESYQLSDTIHIRTS